MLPILRERLTLLLIGLLPFHAFLVTVLTKLIAGPDHRPLVWLALWKEAMLGLVLVIAFIEILHAFGTRKMVRGTFLSLDRIDGLILLLSVVALVVSMFHVPFSMFNVVLGAKYDFLPLLAFIILRRVEWSEWWRSSVMTVLIVDGVILSAYGIATLFLPMGFFTTLGYSDLHSLYLPDGPIAAFQQLGGSGIRRVQSAMSGPNQLGIWLLIPLGILLAEIRTRKVSSFWFPAFAAASVGRLVSGFILLAGLVATFSRAAWVAAIAMAFVAWFLQSKPVFRLGGFLEGAGIVLLTMIAVALLIPSVFLRLQSTSDHLRRPIEALRIIREHPFGLGLGSAGPASNAMNDTCVDLPEGADGSWARNRSDLCVFIDGNQVQPVDRPCDCPLLTENWYLQWGVEMGWAGLLLSLLLPFFVWRKFQVSRLRSSFGGQAGFKFQVGALATDDWPLMAFLAFLGISIAGLFLHSFEDSAVAYTIWVLLAVALKPDAGLPAS